MTLGDRDAAWDQVVVQLLRACALDFKVSEPTQTWLAEAATPHLPLLRRRRIDSLLYLTRGLDVSAQRVYDRVWAAQRAALNDLVLELASIRPVVIKGAEFLLEGFFPHALGFIADVDVLVPRRALGAVKQTLYTKGFRQGIVDETTLQVTDLDVRDVASIEYQHYQLAPFLRLDEIEIPSEDIDFVEDYQRQPLWRKEGRSVVLIEVDVHHSVADNVDADDLFTRLVPSALGAGWALSPADQVWVTLSRLYTEVALHGKRSVRDFAYVLPLLRKGEIDWDVVLEANRRYGLRANLYYYLRFLAALGVPVPSAVVDELHPSRGDRTRDFGWQLATPLHITDPCPVTLPWQERR